MSVSASGRSSAACGATRIARRATYVYGSEFETIAYGPSPSSVVRAVVVEHAGADAGAPVVAPQPCVDGRDRERRVREIPLHLRALLDLGDDRGVEARAEVEHEVPTVGVPEADPAERPRGE